MSNRCILPDSSDNLCTIQNSNESAAKFKHEIFYPCMIFDITNHKMLHSIIIDQVDSVPHPYTNAIFMHA